MRRNRVLIVLALAILSGSIAGYSALRFMQERPTPLVASEPRSTQPVVVAARDLALGDVVSEEDVRMVEWPGDVIPEGYASTVPEVLGRGVLTSVTMNEPLLEAKLGDVGVGGGMPLIIPEGMRAVSIRVNDVIGVAGFAIPQTRVDVLLTITPPGGDNPITKIVLQNVPMLALDQTIHRDEEGNPIPATVATVLVTPEDAEKLVHAAAQGSIQMALRNVLDLEAITTDGSRVSSLLGTTSGGGGGRGRTVRVPPTTEADTTSGIIEVYRGGVRTLISY